MSQQPTLYYIHDPMCSWCYAFREGWQKITEYFAPKLQFARLLGGLAPDNDVPMDEATKAMIQHNWRRIEACVPGVIFNYDFWERCQPRRSTYPACRAVITARALKDESYDLKMTHAIQDGYYRQATNPSDNSTLIDLARALGLDSEQFASGLKSVETGQRLQQEIAQARSMGVTSFPTLVLLSDQQQRRPISINYQDTDAMIATIEGCLQ